MLRRFFLKMFCSYLFLVLFTMNYSDSTLSIPLGEHPLTVAWETLGIPIAEIRIEGWKKIEDGFNQLDKLERLAESYRRRLGLRMELPPVKGEEEGFSFVSLDGILPQKKARLILTFQSVKSPEYKGETHCGFLGYADSVSGLNKCLRFLEKGLQWEEEMNPFFLAVRGRWAGRLNEEEATTLMKEAFNRVKAVCVCAEPAGSAGRWSGRSKYIKGKTVRNGEEVNLEFVYKYDELNEVTNITLGLPAVQ
ncbi:MAG TPA: hypothetical protein GXZ36_09185 [Firmicutes bacterium]|nr:hypothetical protein [Bacillota bacterium]